MHFVLGAALALSASIEETGGKMAVPLASCEIVMGAISRASKG